MNDVDWVRDLGGLLVAAAVGCSVIHDLDALKDNAVSDAGAGTGAAAGSGGLCAKGKDCSGCTGCTNFCECAAAKAFDSCLAACSDAGVGGDGGSGGSVVGIGGFDSGDASGIDSSSSGGAPGVVKCASEPNCDGCCENNHPDGWQESRQVAFGCACQPQHCPVPCGAFCLGTGNIDQECSDCLGTNQAFLGCFQQTCGGSCAGYNACLESCNKSP